MSLTTVELSIGKQPHEVCSISWLDMIPLQMQRYVLECDRVSINVEGPYCTSNIVAIVFSNLYLALEVLGEV